MRLPWERAQGYPMLRPFGERYPRSNPHTDLPRSRPFRRDSGDPFMFAEVRTTRFSVGSDPSGYIDVDT